MKKWLSVCFTMVIVVSAASCWSQTPAAWSAEQKPFQIFGNTYYVGTKGLSSILITSKEGHILIDGTLPTSAQAIVAHVRALGFRIEDVKLMLNTHVHYDHAGGMAELQKLSRARVAASAPTAKVLASGEAADDDPQFGQLPKIASIADVQVIKDLEELRVGNLVVTAHFTPGHTPGGTSWTWRSCERQKCFNIVYADSLNPISVKGYLYSDPKRLPNGAAQLEHSYSVLGGLACDILLTPHPELSGLLEKLARREARAANDPFIDASACRNYVQISREKLAQRIADETAH
jgi:metallo-beta-lactamase class B